MTSSWSSSNTIKLPEVVRKLMIARNELRDHYCSIVSRLNGEMRLRFTLDGNLIGDLGESLAAEVFGIRLVGRSSVEGVDGHTKGGKSVQVKATGTGRGPAFRSTETVADFLLFFEIRLEKLEAEVVFNGPERYARNLLPDVFEGQRSLTNKQIRTANEKVSPAERLRPMGIGAFAARKL